MIITGISFVLLNRFCRGKLTYESDSYWAQLDTVLDRAGGENESHEAALCTVPCLHRQAIDATTIAKARLENTQKVPTKFINMHKIQKMHRNIRQLT
jgi:hypothetical protein